MPYYFELHWCLIILNLENQTILHLDSLNDIDPETRINRFLGYLEECPNTFYLKNIKWKIGSVNFNLPEQTDGYNCGSYIMFYMDVFSGYSIPTLNFNPDIFRFDLAFKLLQDSLTMEKFFL